MSKPVQTIQISGFDPGGEPSILVMDDGSVWAVFNFMPPSYTPEEEYRDLGSFADFDRQMERAVGVPVVWEDREAFSIAEPQKDTIERLKRFLEEYHKK